MSEIMVRFLLQRRQFIGLMLALLVLLGSNAFFDIPKTEDPQTDGPMFYITAVLPGATPLEIEQLVTKPIEDAVYSIGDVRELRSVSREAVSGIYVEFEWEKDAERKNDALSGELAALRRRLPPELLRLEIVRGRPTSAVIAEVALVSETLPMRRLEKLAERLREQLGTVDGVQKAEIWGIATSEMRVSLDADRLAGLGVTPIEVVQTLQSAGREGPIGTVQSADRRFNLRYAGAFLDAEAVGNVTVASKDGGLLKVRDMADIGWSTAPPDHLVRFNGTSAALVTVTQKVNGNVLKITEEARDVLDKFERSLPGGVSLKRPFFQTDNVEYRLGKLYRDFFIAFFLVCVMLLPLGFRAALVVMVAIPLSLFVGVIALDLLGFSLNQLSIAGFILALGILVDDAIVVTENIVRRMRQEPDADSAVIAGTAQISKAVIGCTACLIFAFLPLLSLPEASGDFIRSLPVAVVATVAGSLLVSLWVIPLVARLLVRKEQHPDGNRLLRALKRAIETFYAPVLKRSLDRPRLALTLLLAVTLLSIPMLFAIGTSLFPLAQTREFLVRVEAPEGAPIATTNKIAKQVERELLAEPGVAWVISNVGRGNPPIYYNQPQWQDNSAFAELVVGVSNWDIEARSDLTNRLRAKFARNMAANLSVIEFVQGPVIEAPVVIRIAGRDIETLKRLAGQAEAAMKQVPSLSDVRNPLKRPQIDLTLQVDDAAASALDVKPGELRETLRLALSGVVATKLRDSEGDEYPVKVRLPGSDANKVDRLSEIYVPGNAGQSVALTSIAAPKLISGPAQIGRIDRMRVVTLTANVKPDILISDATGAAEESVRKAVQLPPGYNVSLGGEAESQARSFAGLVPAALIAMFGILIVLVLEFGQFRMVSVVVGIIPFGLFGAIAALWVTGNSLSFTASIGLIALIGIEIKNSIILVDFAEQMRLQGMGIRQAAEEAGELRFLPVVLTSVTAIGGLLPLAWENSGLYAPMAIAIIGGLVASTVLARIATPVMYLLLARPERQPAHQ
jgi:multidrug efflux pump subunit AcrB